MMMNRNLSNQFEFLRSVRSDPYSDHERVEFTAAEHDSDEAAATVVYNAPVEKLAMNQLDIFRDPSGQGQMFYSVPATGNLLAVAEEHRGRGLGTAMTDLVIDEHQRRFGHQSFPQPNSMLSADSSEMLTKITGKKHRQTWGTGIDQPEPGDYEDIDYDEFSGEPNYLRPEDRFALDELGEATDRLHANRGDLGYSDTVSRVQPSGITNRIRQQTASTPPEFAWEDSLDGPRQSDWRPGHDRLFDPGPRTQRVRRLSDMPGTDGKGAKYGDTPLRWRASENPYSP